MACLQIPRSIYSCSPKAGRHARHGWTLHPDQYQRPRVTLDDFHFRLVERVLRPGCGRMLGWIECWRVLFLRAEYLWDRIRWRYARRPGPYCGRRDNDNPEWDPKYHPDHRQLHGSRDREYGGRSQPPDSRLLV